jgi:hypothetical protein
VGFRSLDGIQETGEPVYYECLCGEQDYRYLNCHKISGLKMILSETIIVVAPAGGWLTRRNTMITPESESTADKTLIMNLSQETRLDGCGFLTKIFEGEP